MREEWLKVIREGSMPCGRCACMGAVGDDDGGERWEWALENEDWFEHWQDIYMNSKMGCEREGKKDEYDDR